MAHYSQRLIYVLRASIYRALQLHPNTPALYILAASHELSNLSPSSARTLLQRGIRLNNDSVELWTEYVKMELGFVEGLRRRWDVLGINVETQAKGNAKEMPLDLEESENQMLVDEDNRDATRAIMEGEIVKSVISSAAKCASCASLTSCPMGYYYLMLTYNQRYPR